MFLPAVPSSGETSALKSLRVYSHKLAAVSSIIDANYDAAVISILLPCVGLDKTILIHKCPVVKQAKQRGHIFSLTQYSHHWKLQNSVCRKAQSLEFLPHVKNVYDSANQK
jgi:hypothetical protein